MNLTKHSLTAAALAITISVGGASAAFAGGGDGDGSSTGRDAKIAKVCENSDQIVAKITERQTNLNARLAKLAELRVKADEAGRTKLVTKIDKRIERLQAALDRVTERLAQAPTWIAEHCS